jgi:exosome complex RNA-binding protein Rrp42 (RNase PH superfamily)
MRTDNRTAGELRPVEIVTGCLMTAEGSALIKVGQHPRALRRYH